MVDKVMAARKDMERAAKGAAAAKPALGQQHPQGQPGGQPQQAKVGNGSHRCHRLPDAICLPARPICSHIVHVY